MQVKLQAVLLNAHTKVVYVKQIVWANDTTSRGELARTTESVLCRNLGTCFLQQENLFENKYYSEFVLIKVKL